MTPKDISTHIDQKRKALQVKQLETKDGYSFWFGAPAHTNRILRVSRSSPSSPTKLKLAVSDRLDDVKATKQTEFTFEGDLEHLLSLVDEEVRLYLARIQPLEGK